MGPEQESTPSSAEGPVRARLRGNGAGPKEVETIGKTSPGRLEDLGNEEKSKSPTAEAKVEESKLMPVASSRGPR